MAFRIRLIPDATAPSDAAAIRQAQEILRKQFPDARPSDIDNLPDRLVDPLAQQLRTLLFVAESGQGRVRGCAIVLHAPDLGFCYLDFLASMPGRAGGGVGGAVYQRVRDEARALGAEALVLECPPDDPALCPDPLARRQNANRLRFYEAYGARPVINTAYETPMGPGDVPPHLVIDGLGMSRLPGRDRIQVFVRAVLERRYGDRCPPDYIEAVVASFRDDPPVLRPPRYQHPASPPLVLPASSERIAMVVTDQHEIHHVNERGYVEAPVRIRTILAGLLGAGLFERVEPKDFPDTHILRVHDRDFVEYLKAACANVGPERSIYPYVFPVRNQTRPPHDLPVRAGYFCIDTFTPLNRHAYVAARRAVDCALTAAERVLEGRRAAYALVRPPGHHAERNAFGGFCYFNNAAIAAGFLAAHGPVAVLDIDYHHGNGTQSIFYDRSDVLTVSIHGHPNVAYPYFTGFRDEEGRGDGVGFNLNLPLPESISVHDYREALDQAMARIEKFDPRFLVLAVGFDTARGDPTGSWRLEHGDFNRIGRLIGETGYPLLVVQEGGYRTRTLGVNARRFFEGLAIGLQRPVRPRPPPPPKKPEPEPPLSDVVWRTEVIPDDVDAVQAMVAATGVFSRAEIAIAGELVSERLAKGDASDYYFVLAERGGRLAGYACFGPIDGTEHRFDLYWIAVHPTQQRGGLGADLMRRTLAAVAAAGGVSLFVDTSSREDYKPARGFYRRHGFRKVAELPDFFADGDGKVIFARRIRNGGSP